MKNKLQITSVRIETKIDESPDTSWLGQFTDDASKPYAIIRFGKHCGEFAAGVESDDLPERSREYRYFAPVAENYKGESEATIREYCLADWQRMESLNDGQWCFVGVIAKAELWNQDTGCTQTIRSAGVWGIESDSDKDHLKSVAAEQLDELKSELLALGGFGTRAIEYAIKNCEL